MNEGASGQTTYISLERTENWRVFGVRDVYAFLASLGQLFSEDAILYVEGSSISRRMSAFYSVRSLEDDVKVGVDPREMPGPRTITEKIIHLVFREPSYRAYRIRLTRENVEALSEEIEHNSEPEIADNIGIYRDRTVLLEGNDWYDGIYYISDIIEEDRLREFCQTQGCKYERSRDYAVEE